MVAMRFTALALPLLLVACGGQVASPEPSDAVPEVDVAEPEPGCPKVPPREGDECAVDPGYRFECSYGDDPIALCRPHFQCVGKVVGGRQVDPRWQRISPSSWCDREAGVCPASPAEGAACDALGAGCSYGAGLFCYCADATATHWACARATAGCPPLPPNAGTPCAGDVTCHYDVSSGRCTAGVSASCDTRGLWRWSYGCAE